MPPTDISSNRYMRSSLSARNLALANASRRTSSWGFGLKPAPPQKVSSERLSEERATALQGRLEEMLVFELHKDGGREYLNLSVRGLYKHVLSAITTPYKSHEELKDPAKHIVSTESTDAPTTDSETQPDNSGDKQVSFDQQVQIQNVALPGIIEEAPGMEDVTYRERLGGYLHPRDMRRLVTPFSSTNEPELIVRRHVMLLNFDPLRAIILRDRLLVLVPEGADSLLIKLENRVRGGSAEVENSVFGAPSEGAPSEIGSSIMDDTNISEQSVDGSQKEQGVFGKLFGKGNHEKEDELQTSQHSTGSKKRKGPAASSAAGKVISKIKESITQSGKKSENNDTEEYSPTEDTEYEMFGEWEEMNAKDWIDLPFELQCTDAVLHVVCSILSEDTFDMEQAALEYIDDVLNGKNTLSEDPLAGIRHAKDALREMGSRIRGFVQSMNRILDEDEDMALMNLSRLISHPERFIKPVTQEELEQEADEPELILEAHLQIGLTLNNSLDLIQGKIDTASELVDQKLDSVRNRILFANMIISVVSLSVATASLVGSLFGMNVTNFLERDENAFFIIVTATVVGCFSLMCFIMLMLIWSGTIPLPGLSGSAG